VNEPAGAERVAAGPAGAPKATADSAGGPLGAAAPAEGAATRATGARAPPHRQNDAFMSEVRPCIRERPIASALLPPQPVERLLVPRNANRARRFQPTSFANLRCSSYEAAYVRSLSVSHRGEQPVSHREPPPHSRHLPHVRGVHTRRRGSVAPHSAQVPDRSADVCMRPGERQPRRRDVTPQHGDVPRPILNSLPPRRKCVRSGDKSATAREINRSGGDLFPSGAERASPFSDASPVLGRVCVSATAIDHSPLSAPSQCRTGCLPRVVASPDRHRMQTEL
jgi:hypothetical protein